ncbi:sigma-54 interaction domain-containing protein [Calidifontibacillus erzurumensis]|uniref:sigma-54 interaction domain-containing protein n=1 Tax=Calidifontibacillus erzurumensis TaxID=2741433 RepID=UPI0035B52CDC
MLNAEEIFNTKLLDILFASTNYGTVIVNSSGIIQYMSNNYCKFLGVERSEVIGKHVTEIIENTRMHLVARTGKSEMADLQFLRGNFVIANRLPIILNNEIIGAIGYIIFRDIEDWNKTHIHIKELLSKHNYFRNEQSITKGVKYTLSNFIGESLEIKKIKEKIKKIASGDISVLIRGESGTGKEIVAHCIHQYSNRSDKPFIKVNCGAIPEQLIESELFGYAEGAFTGAKRGGKKGKFELADGGTIFLDEIGDMPLHMQVKLLRVLQEKEIEPVGALHPKKVDVRVIAATNCPLEKLIEKKQFREDLYYRINAIQIFIPPLRDRTEDIPLLANYFLKKYTVRIGKRITSIDSDVFSLLEKYDWPGNIRELENVIYASVHLTNDEILRIEALPDYLKSFNNKKFDDKRLKDIVEETEKRVIEKTLKKFNFDKKKAAKSLGLGISTLYDKIKKYQIIDQ